MEVYLYSFFNLWARCPRVLGETVILGFTKRVKNLDHANRCCLFNNTFFARNLLNILCDNDVSVWGTRNLFVSMWRHSGNSTHVLNTQHSLYSKKCTSVTCQKLNTHIITNASVCVCDTIWPWHFNSVARADVEVYINLKKTFDIFFDIVCTVHRNQFCKQTNKMHFLYVLILRSLLYNSTCFERLFRSSSGVHKFTVSAALYKPCKRAC